MYNAVVAMYSDPQAKILLNEFETDFFLCPIGLKQGACESPILFSIYVNSLAQEIKASNIGVKICTDLNCDCSNMTQSCTPEIISILLYCEFVMTSYLLQKMKKIYRILFL